MTDLAADARRFRINRLLRERSARQRVALRLICGLDVEALQPGAIRQPVQIRGRVARMIERERLRGLRGDGSYDLDRHIALTQALASVPNAAGLRKPGRNGPGGKPPGP